MAKTPVKKKKPKSYPKLTAAQERQIRSETAFVAKSASSAAKKPKAKKKAPTTVVGKINDQGLIGKMLTPRTTLMRAILGKKKKPVKKAK